MLVWIISVVVTAILILTLGWLVSLELDEYGSNDWARRMVTSVGLGLTFLVLISYILIATVGFSGVNSIIALSSIIGLLILRKVLAKVVYVPYQDPNQQTCNEKLHQALKELKSNWLFIVVDIVAIIYAAYLSISFSMAGVLYRSSLPELDPWFWLFNTRYLLINNVPYWHNIKAYPIGMLSLVGTTTFMDPSYDFVYNSIRFICPVFAVLNVGAVYLVSRRAFRGSFAPPLIVTLGFTVSHHVQFSQRLGRPELVALLLFILTLGYLFVYESPSTTVSCILVLGVFLYHPLTCAVVIGIWTFSKLIGPKSLPSKQEFRSIINSLIVTGFLLLPVLLLHIANSEFLSNYTYYVETGGASIPEDPWNFGLGRLEYLGLRTLGTFLFSVMAIVGVRDLISNNKNKWKGGAFLFFVTWMMLSWIPNALIGGYALRAASWAAFPLSMLLGQLVDEAELSLLSRKIKSVQRTELHPNLVRLRKIASLTTILRAIKSFVQNPHRLTRFKNALFNRSNFQKLKALLPSREILKTLTRPHLSRWKIVVLVIVIAISQINYGESYRYLGQRFISDRDRLTMEWVLSYQQNVTGCYMYEEHIAIGNRVLYPIQIIANDSWRTQDSAFFQSKFGNKYHWVIYVKSGEALHQHALNRGWLEVFNEQVALELGWTIFTGSDIYLFRPTA